MLEMRIVGLSELLDNVTVQLRWTGRRGWSQPKFTLSSFSRFMKIYFPKYYNYYLIAMEQQDYKEECAVWFYHFGETHDMRVKGIPYVFENREYPRF